MRTVPKKTKTKKLSKSDVPMLEAHSLFQLWGYHMRTSFVGVIFVHIIQFSFPV